MMKWLKWLFGLLLLGTLGFVPACLAVEIVHASATGSDATSQIAEIENSADLVDLLKNAFYQEKTPGNALASLQRIIAISEGHKINDYATALATSCERLLDMGVTEFPVGNNLADLCNAHAKGELHCGNPMLAPACASLAEFNEGIGKEWSAFIESYSADELARLSVEAILNTAPEGAAEQVDAVQDTVPEGAAEQVKGNPFNSMIFMLVLCLMLFGIMRAMWRRLRPRKVTASGSVVSAVPVIHVTPVHAPQIVKPVVPVKVVATVPPQSAAGGSSAARSQEGAEPAIGSHPAGLSQTDDKRRDILERLERLHKDGIISDDEYEQEKTRVVGKE